MSRPRFPRRVFLLLATALVGCAPAYTANPERVLSGDEAAAVCAAGPRVTDRSVLLYGPADGDTSLPPDYTLQCPELYIRAKGRVVTVRARDLAAALATFDGQAFVLSYYADLRVRPGADRVDADPPDVSEELRDEVNQVTVTVLASDGVPRPLLAGGQVTPVALPAGPYLIRTEAGRSANPWPSVFLDPEHGIVVATMSP